MKTRVDSKEIEEIIAKHFEIDPKCVAIRQKINAFTSDEIYAELDVEPASDVVIIKGEERVLNPTKEEDLKIIQDYIKNNLDKMFNFGIKK